MAAPKNFEPFDAKALMNHKFRETEKKQWKTKRGYVVSMKAPDLPLREYQMNQTGTDTPFEDGFKALGYSHYRKRIPERELTSSEFKRYDKTSTREVAFLGKDIVGSIRK